MKSKKPKVSKKKKNTKEVVLFLDIRSSSIGGAFVEIFENKPPKIIYTTRIFKYFKKLQDSTSFVNIMMDVTKEVLHDLHNSGLREVRGVIGEVTVKEAFVLYSSPWYISKIKNISIKKEKPFIFTKELFEDLIKEEAKTITKSKSVEIIEKDITHVTVNGYQTDNPFNKNIRTVDLSFFISEMSKKTVDEVEDKIDNLFSIKKIIHHSHPLALFSVLRNKFMNTPNFIFLDIGGEVTDIGIVRNDAMIHNISVPYGKNYFIRGMGKKNKSDSPVILSMMNMLSENNSDQDRTKKQIADLEKVKRKWLENISNALSTIIPLEEVPHQVFVTSDTDSSNLFLNILKSEDAKEVLFKSKNNIIASYVDNKILNDLLTYNPNTRKDNFIELAVSFVHTNQ